MSSYYSAGTYPVSGTVLNAFNSVSPFFFYDIHPFLLALGVLSVCVNVLKQL